MTTFLHGVQATIEQKSIMTDIKPYTISVPDSKLQDLKDRLERAQFPDELDAAGWDLGTPLAEVKRLTVYWAHNFDWRKAEAKLNEQAHYTTFIQCDGFEPLNIHFLYKRSEVPGAIPLLYVHGWPGSFLEGSKFFEKLAAGDGETEPAFDVVVVSLPNFGFSDGPKMRGFAIEQYAETMNKLMLKLGYNEYVTQGGDWGFYITRAISLLYPENCKATHLNFINSVEPSFIKYPLLAIEHALKPYGEREKKGATRTKWFMQEGSGYRAEQSTKPQTLGYALADSPVALLGWIYEKLHDWTDSYPWTEDEICTWMSIYWFSTAGPAASVRIYYEATHTWKQEKRVTRARTGEWIPHVKVGFSHQPKELRVTPDSWVKKLGNIVFNKHNDSGGHFFAWEKPDTLVLDVRDMFRRGGGAYGAITDRDGYYST